MFNKKIIISLLLLLFLTCGVASAFDFFGDGLEYEDIYVEQFVCEVTNYSDIHSDGKIDERYVYSIKFDLKNVSSSLVDSKFVTYLYSNGTLITTNDKYNENTTIIGEHSYFDEFKHLYGNHELWIDHYVNITSCDLVIFKDGKVVFNETKPFYMGNYKDDVYIEGSQSNNDGKDTSSSNNVESTYVASSNSNKFHESYCSQAHRISDANKITFSSRDEALNAGYEPCEICYP